MHIPKLLGFDGAIVGLLASLGVVSAVILALVASALGLQSWIEKGRQLVNVSRELGVPVGRALWTVAVLRPVRVVAALAVTACVPVVQLALLSLCYLAGNYLSMATVDRARGQAAVALIRAQHWAVLRPSPLSTVLRLDWISGGYLLLAVGCVVASYRVAIARGDPTRPGQVLGFPALMLSWLGLLAAAVIGVILVFDIGLVLLGSLAGVHVGRSVLRDTLRAVLPLVLGLADGTLCYAACVAGTRASSALAGAWGRSVRHRRGLEAYLFWG